MISKDRIKAFEDKNALLVDMFINKFSTHVVDFFGKDSTKVMPKAKLKEISNNLVKALSVSKDLQEDL